LERKELIQHPQDTLVQYGIQSTLAHLDPFGGISDLWDGITQKTFVNFQPQNGEKMMTVGDPKIASPGRP
jgi:hypothetical protein